MQCFTVVWYLVLLISSAVADEEDREQQAKIGITEDEQIPVSDHEHPRENVPTKPDYRAPGHWATPAPDSGIKLGFVPIKTYAQVRRSISVKHLPRSDAIASATTAEEIANAPRLREVVSTKKISEVYTEEGYEDSAYDHGGFAKEAENHENYDRKEKPVASKHHDSVAQGTNPIVNKFNQRLPPGTWERHKVIRNETRMMFLGNENGKNTVPMKVVASYSHTIQHPDMNGDIVESGSVNKPLTKASRRSSAKVPRSPQQFTVPQIPNDSSLVSNHHMLVGNHHPEVSHSSSNQLPVTANYHPALPNNRLLLRNHPSVAPHHSLLIQSHPSVVLNNPSSPSNPKPVSFNPQNYILLSNDPSEQTNAKYSHPLNENIRSMVLQNNPQNSPNTRPATHFQENLPLMLLPNNPQESSPQITANSPFLPLSAPHLRTRPVIKENTQLVLLQNNPAVPSNTNPEEISLHYSMPPVIIEPDTPIPAAPRRLIPAPQGFRLPPRKFKAHTINDFLTPPPQYALTARELTAFAKSNKKDFNSQGRSPNVSAPVQSLEPDTVNNVTSNESKEEESETKRPIITNSHLPWGVVKARKIPVSKLIPLKESSNDDENPVNANDSPSTISKIIKPVKVESKSVNSPHKTSKLIKVSDPRKNDSYSNELPHLAKIVEALTLAHYAPKNEQNQDTKFKSSGRKQNAAKYVHRNKDLQDMLTKVYVSKQKSIQARNRAKSSNDNRSGRHNSGTLNIQMQQEPVESRISPARSVKNLEENSYAKRAPRISRKVDKSFFTKDPQYLSGDDEESRLIEEERLLDEEKDKELEQNVEHWKEALIEADNPKKPKIDSKKYPFYNLPTTKSISPYSPLRYATNPKDIPRKTEGGMEFYESRESVQCPEVVGKLDVIPKRSSSGEWNTKPKAKLPRLRGLGDKIDCLKTKYFGEEPLDNPFFNERAVGLPKATSSRKVERVSADEDELGADPLGFYADILQNVRSIQNPGSFPLHSSSNRKTVKSREKNIKSSGSNYRSPEPAVSYNAETEQVSSKLSAQNTQEISASKPKTEVHRKPKNRNLPSLESATDVPKENNPISSKRPVHSQKQHEQHVSKNFHAETSKRTKEKEIPDKKEVNNIRFQTGFKPLLFNTTHTYAASSVHHQRAHPNLHHLKNPIERPHGMHYGVSPHPYTFVLPKENVTSMDQIEVTKPEVSKDYNNIIGMQPPPVNRNRVIVKMMHRPPKEYPTSIAELLPGNPKSFVAAAQRTHLKRIKEFPSMSPPPLQYRLPSDSRRVATAGAVSGEEQNIDEMLASESQMHHMLRQTVSQARYKRSAEFSEEIVPSIPLGVNDAAPILQRRQDHVVVDRLGNMYYGHINGQDTYWTTAGNEVDPKRQRSYAANVLNDVNKSISNSNRNGTSDELFYRSGAVGSTESDSRRGEPKYKNSERETSGTKLFVSTEQSKLSGISETTNKPNYNSIVSFSTGESRPSISSVILQNTPNRHKEEDNQKETNKDKTEITNKKKSLPLTEAQSSPEVLSPEEINRILSGIMTRHSYSSRYRSIDNPSTTTTTTTTQKPSTTSPRSSTRFSRKRPSKKPRVIPILNGRVIPELITSTTKSPDIKKLRRRLPVTTTTEANIKDIALGIKDNKHQANTKQGTSRRGSSMRRESLAAASSTVSPNIRSAGTQRRKHFSGRENKTPRKHIVGNDKQNNGYLATATKTEVPLNSTSSDSDSNVKSQNPQSKTSHKTSRTMTKNEPLDPTPIPPQRVQAIETRRVTKEEIFTTRYYPEHAEHELEEEETEVRNSDNKRDDVEEDKEIYEPYASQNFLPSHENALQHDVWNEKSKISNKNSEIQRIDDVHVQSPQNYFSDLGYEQKVEVVKSPQGSVDENGGAISVFPQNREEFKDVTVLTYVVDPRTGIGKWIADTEDSYISEESATYSKARKNPSKIKKEHSAIHSNTEHAMTVESDSAPHFSTEHSDISENSHDYESTSPITHLDISDHSSNSALEEHHTSPTSETDDYYQESGYNGNHDRSTHGRDKKQKKILKHIPKDKVMSTVEDRYDNSDHQLEDDRTTSDLYVLVSLLPSSEDRNTKPVKYVKHPGERKYFYVQDDVDDEAV